MLENWLSTAFDSQRSEAGFGSVDFEEATCAFIGAICAAGNFDERELAGYWSWYQPKDLLIGGLRVAVDVAAEFTEGYSAAVQIIGEAVVEEVDLDQVRYGVTLSRLVERAYRRCGTHSAQAAYNAIIRAVRQDTGEEPEAPAMVAMAIRIAVHACQALCDFEAEQTGGEPQNLTTMIDAELTRVHRIAVDSISTPP